MSEAKRTDELQGDILHVYDGIEEADNELPIWWLFTFYGAIVFAVFYWFAYHEFDVLALPNQAYGAEVSRRAANGGVVTEEMLNAVAQNPAEVGAGRGLFQQHCVVCHGANAQGQIGPNLTDGSWIHGGSAMDIHTTIRDGVTSNGMPNWGAPLGAAAVRRLSAYVVSLRDTNVPGKEPQGEPYVPGAATP